MIDTKLECISDVHVHAPLSYCDSLYNTISKIKLLRILHMKLKSFYKAKK